jgi:alpha-tubulin suppressor-like RCC1 family protein
MGRTIALTADGAVYLWGHNANADPQGPEFPPPVPRTLAFYTAQFIAEVSPAQSAASGRGVSAFVVGDGGALRLLTGHSRSTVSAPGGRAGWFVFDVPETSGFVQVVAQEPTFFALRNDGTVWQFVSFVDGDVFHFSPPAQVRGFADVVQLAAGTHHLLALRSDGTVLAKGSNEHGQIGDGSGETAQDPVAVPGLTDITRIAAGDEHSLALRAEGTALAWGRGDSGQIGNGLLDAARPVQVINANGSALTALADVAAGAAHSVLLRTDGTVLTWGRGSEGQLGRDVDQTLSPTPVGARPASGVVAGANVTLQLDQAFAGVVFGWGDNAEGELGDGTAQRRRTPVTVLGLGRGQPTCGGTANPGG